MAQIESILAQRAVASGLLTAADLARCRAELGDDAADSRITEWLVKQGLLTKWQAAQLEAGRTQNLILGHYKLLAPLGAGGMGSVYRAFDTEQRRQVALKILPPRLAKPEALGRFRREALVASQLRHDNVVTSFELAQHGSLHYLVMELVDGPSLSAHLAKKRRLSVREAARIGYEVALALEHAREQSIIHRDIKPSNILLSRQGQVKLADMGLAKFFGPQAQDGGPETRTGQFMGTIDYCSPEQAVDAKRADIRSDIYSLGCTLYHCLTGKPPFAEGTEVQRIMAHLDILPAPIRVKNREVPETFAELIEKRMLAKDPGDRYQTPAEAAEALAPWARGEEGAVNLWAGLEGLEGLLEVAAQAPRVDVPKPPPQSDRDTARHLKSPKTRRAVKLRLGAKDESVLWRPLGLVGLVLLILGTAVAASLLWPRSKPESIPQDKTNPPEEGTRKRPHPDEISNALTDDEISEGWKLLFDGKGLAGWQSIGNAGPGYVVEDGILVCPKDGGGNLLSSKEYANFVLRFEYRLEPGGNNGVALRAPSEGNAALTGMESQILDDDAPEYANLEPSQYHGSIYNVVAAKRGAPRKAGEWNTEEIVCDGRHVQVTVNGQMTVDGNLDDVKDPEFLKAHPGVQRERGYVGFLGHRPSRVEFRNIRIKELPASTPRISDDSPPPKVPDLTGTPEKPMERLEVDVPRAAPAKWDDNRDAGEDTKFVGGGGGVGQRIARPGELLRGIECKVDKVPRGRLKGFPYIADIVPVFAKERPHQLPSGYLVPEGYAVGAVKVDMQFFIKALQLVYMPVKADGTLDPAGSKVGPWIGHSGGGRIETITGDGAPIIGLHVQKSDAVYALALVVGRNTRLVQRQEWPGVHIYHTDFSSDGRFYLGGGDGGALRVWELASGRQVQELPVPVGNFTPGGKYVVGHNYGKAILVFDVATGTKARTWEPSTVVAGLAISPDGKQVVSSHVDGIMRLWDFATGQMIRPFTGHALPPEMVFSADGKLLLSASEDKTVRLWDVKSGNCTQTFEKFPDAAPIKGTNLIVRAFFRPGEREIVGYVWGQSKRMLVWDVASGEVLRRIDLGDNFEKDAVISRGGRLVLSAHADNTLRLRNLSEGAEVERFAMPALPRGAQLSSDGHHLVSGSLRTGLNLWRVDRMALRTAAMHNLEHKGAVWSVAFSPDGALIASGGDDNTVRLWETKTGVPKPPLTGHLSEVRGLAFSPSGDTLASASFDRTIRLWDPRTGQLQGTPLTDTAGVYFPAFTRDGRTLVTGSDDKSPRVWNVGERKFRRLDGHKSTAWAAAISIPRNLIASGGGDSSVRLWKLDDGQFVRALPEHPGGVNALAFSNDGKLLASAEGGAQQRVSLWDSESGELLRTLPFHFATIHEVAFAPDDQSLATACADGVVRLWDTNSASLRSSYGGGGLCLAFSPDGEYLATGGADSVVRVWQVKGSP